MDSATKGGRDDDRLHPPRPHHHHHQRRQRPRRRPFRILLGITGSVAAVKGPELVCRLMDVLSVNKQSDSDESNNSDDNGIGDHSSSASPVEVRVILTRGGSNFWRCANEYDPSSWTKLQERMNAGASRSRSTGGVNDNHAEETVVEDTDPPIIIYESDHEWKDWKRMGDSVLHIDLRNWADVLVVAPLSAHSLAKFATGLCDDTLSCVVRAWFSSTTPTTTVTTSMDTPSLTTNKPMIVAPAMNTGMWQHPITAQQLQTLQSFAPDPAVVTVVAPQVKVLACGEVGDGALAPLEAIVEAVAQIKQRIMEGES